MNLKEIAKETGFSVSVISRALNPSPDKSCNVSAKTREKIRAAVEKLDFQRNHAAACIRKGKHPSIGIFLPPFSGSLACDAVIGVSEEAGILNLPLNFYFGGGSDLSTFLQTMNSQENTGIIVYYREMYEDLQTPFTEQLKQFCRNGGKVVLYNEQPAGDPLREERRNGQVALLTYDDIHGGYQAAQYLHQCDCACYAVLFGPARCSSDRANGFRQYFAERNLPAHIDQIYVTTPDRRADHLEIQRALANYRGNLPLGIFIPSDYLMLDVIRIAEKFGLQVGRDLRVVGYNDSDFVPFIGKPLATLRQDFKEEGRIALQMLGAMLDGGKVEDRTLLPELRIYQEM